jgi:hypothetical protein
MAMASSAPMFLEYRGRYLSQQGEPDHLMDVEAIHELLDRRPAPRRPLRRRP